LGKGGWPPPPSVALIGLLGKRRLSARAVGRAQAASGRSAHSHR